MRNLWICLLALSMLFGATLAGAAPGKTGESKPRTTTAGTKAWEKIIQPDALIVSKKKKKNYLFIVWDVFACRDLFDPNIKTKATTKEKASLALRYGAYIAYVYGFQKNPDYPQARMKIIVINERDEYGGPRWDATDQLYTLTFYKQPFTMLNLQDGAEIFSLKEKALKTLLQEPKEEK